MVLEVLEVVLKVLEVFLEVSYIDFLDLLTKASLRVFISTGVTPYS